MANLLSQKADDGGEWLGGGDFEFVLGRPQAWRGRYRVERDGDCEVVLDAGAPRYEGTGEDVYGAAGDTFF